ncbi:chemotaxis protein CheW [Dechloromonas sp. XY25]|uniref:Chemotaxis protein CheW n=1 Tax=Dechloromonas hankyongensis TaxID=2908002 RepID=A0ABS9JX82_9RHOO|nr:chemotaxis protein CheW [Dechloromonas hankyongensis]MCG2575507.1 chemotaxis protein CheW [Dechloromonas hankyongensis]
MARKTSLRDFQEYLATRLSQAAKGKGAASWLGIEAGGEAWLVDLSDGGEIVQASQLTPVPLTRPWFVGISNIRGNLHAVSDFSVFRGGQPIVQNANARLLLVGARYGINAALLVSRMLGLKNPEDFTPEPSDAAMPAWGQQRFADTHGKIWRKLSVRELLADHDFMSIGV